MAFMKLPGLKGKLYIPEKQSNCKKNIPAKTVIHVITALMIGAGSAVAIETVNLIPF